MTALFFFSLTINIILVLVVVFLSTVTMSLSHFRQRTMKRFIYQSYRVPVVRYRAEVIMPFSDLQDRNLFLMRKHEGNGSPAIGHVCDTLIDSILDTVREDLQKSHQTLRIDYIRDGYQYRFVGELKIAIVPPNDDEMESFRHRVITDPYLTHPIISKHF